MSKADNMNELVVFDKDNVHDVHIYIEKSMIRLDRVEPDEDVQKEYFKKNVGAYYRERNRTIEVGQKIKRDGEGNADIRSLTININNLGLVDRQKILLEEAEKLAKVGAKMGYTTEEIREAKVIPEVTGKNRMEKDDGK